MLYLFFIIIIENHYGEKRNIRVVVIFRILRQGTKHFPSIYDDIMFSVLSYVGNPLLIYQRAFVHTLYSVYCFMLFKYLIQVVFTWMMVSEKCNYLQNVTWFSQLLIWVKGFYHRIIGFSSTILRHPIRIM